MFELDLHMCAKYKKKVGKVNLIQNFNRNGCQISLCNTHISYFKLHATFLNYCNFKNLYEFI